MILGFTGSQSHPSSRALYWLRHQLALLEDLTEVHHGDCVGADALFHDVVRDLLPKAEIHVHPCTLENKRARRIGDVVYPSLPPMARNDAIVAAADRMIALPSGPEQVRSGTWATIRRTRKAGKPLLAYPFDSWENLPTNG